MYLKAVEMIGFKSFAERTKMMFEPGMMAIVGPNGCGKSNVSDAIRWVLGEQSPKALRGGTMTDVIFNGTDQAKPLAMAEVSLTLTDCEAVLGVEYNEVTVTRRVFRSGEGQYFINKTPCRLKDIQRLFMDTGLGTDSYSVMEQGRIDQILSSRPDDRREVFEEASGISKYKADKREALRKLEHTEANLLRLSDIIKEVKRQIISLQRQVGKARRYKNLQEQLRASDVWLAKGRLSELDLALATLEKELGQHQATEDGLRQKVEGAEAAAGALRANMAAVEGRIAAALDASSEASGALARTQELIRVNGERAQELETLSQRDSRESASASASLASHQAELDVLKKDLIAATDAHETARLELTKRQAALTAHDQQTDAARKRLQDLRTEALELESRLARLQNEWNEIEARERTDLIRRERCAAEKAEAERAVESYAERLALMAAQRAQKQTAAEQAQQQVAALRASQADRATQLAQVQQELSRLASASAAREAQVALLTRSREEARGFPAGAKKLLEGATVPGVNPKDILGALAQKVRAPKEDQLALEAVLRSWLDAVLVRDAAAAVAIARQVQAAAGGAVRLLALEAGEVPDTPPGAGEPLLPRVKAAADLAGLLRRLLGAVRVVPTAADMPAAIPAGLTYVTRDGLVARGDGSVEFWAPGENESNPLAREHQLAEWQEDLARLRQEVENHNAQAAALQQDEQAARESMAAAQTAWEAQQREMALAEGEIRMVEREAKQAGERAETIGWELAALLKKTDAGTQRRSEMAGEMEDIRQRQAAVRTQTTADSETLRKLEDERNARLEEATECRVALAGYKQQVDGLRARGEPLEARLRELTALISERAAGIDSYRERIAALAAATANAQQQLAPLNDEVARCQAELQEARALRDRQNAELTQSDAALHSLRAELDTIREQRNTMEVQLARHRLHRQNLVERMSAEYSLQPAEILKAKEPEWEEDAKPADREALETMVAEIRTKLQSMGPVNLVAIEEHQELEERYAFLNQQNDDLLSAKQQLLDLIRKINETTTVLFTDTFNKVNDNFQELFKQLFGGGNAKLVLVDEENVLESGIEIIARPPGKKLQTISLLSGGERTLTAVALLFALFKVKPSAFCLTDELDAALDDSNISRYLEMLKGFLKDTQFIVITHNRQTIGSADALYGVTMEKQGISKVVSVKFRGKEKPPAADDTPA
ncbi:MAG TPA: chromosome segregation protein SMC [Kiritimatiellia bacterium]|nr:MAG: Chromosome partition protein Smc [Verrucomicrobia bacterium ADurb.Bin018]HOD99823.1 chromosome segregation protein SMC [Kiritimatiellia bacterium]HOE37235.1 chromosome segregation protein SMC [Kiritimatiellia bacterium]HOR74196.1 chromosome segregation protein SMC [Kiritimatiellia bacterium]HOU58739.1 chromosome segregation protein SMC [Kiritimatiellia bacterium]